MAHPNCLLKEIEPKCVEEYSAEMPSLGMEGPPMTVSSEARHSGPFAAESFQPESVRTFSLTIKHDQTDVDLFRNWRACSMPRSQQHPSLASRLILRPERTIPKDFRPRQLTKQPRSAFGLRCVRILKA